VPRGDYRTVPPVSRHEPTRLGNGIIRKITRERNPFDPGPYCYVCDERLTVFRDVIRKNCCGIYKMVLLCPMCKLRHLQAEKAEGKRFFPAISDRVRRINRWLDQLLT
jgi:hypothetical protein